MLTETKSAAPLLICYLRKCHFWSLCILQLIPLNDKGSSVLPPPSRRKRKVSSCFSDIWVSENSLFLGEWFHHTSEMGRAAPTASWGSGVHAQAVPSAAKRGCVGDLTAWQTLIRGAIPNETDSWRPPGHHGLSLLADHKPRGQGRGCGQVWMKRTQTFSKVSVALSDELPARSSPAAAFRARFSVCSLAPAHKIPFSVDLWPST